MIADEIIRAAATVSALSVLAALIVRTVKYFLERKRQASEIENVKAEMRILCYGLFACLDGLKQMGCDGNVTRAKQELEKHLNSAAHK